MNNGARVSAREGHEALRACSSKEAPSRILLWALSLMSFFEPQSEPRPRYRSGRLQEEQRLVAKTCSFFWRILLSHCPNFAELESSKEAKSYRENPCNRITGKKSFPQRLSDAIFNPGKRTKRPLAGEDSPHKRSSQKAFHKPKGAHKAKGRCAWKKERPHLIFWCEHFPVFAWRHSIFFFEGAEEG